MAWLGSSHGVFKLHSSDQFCGSYMSLEDAAEILEVPTDALQLLPGVSTSAGVMLSELDIHRALGAGAIPTNLVPRGTTVSFDELILRKLLQLTLPGVDVEQQVAFGRQRVDLRVSYSGSRIMIEFVGPAHFIPQFTRELRSPIDRKRRVEDHFGVECVIWPFWIQRCSANVQALSDATVSGLASVWSTRAFFGDFVYPDSADVIIAITERFNALRNSGIGYMYLAEHTTKPEHPIVARISTGKVPESKLVPRGNSQQREFWLPSRLW